MPKVSEQYKEEKKNLILQGALRCFGEKGYEATTIDDIVRVSNLSKGAIYNYFTSKEEIYLQLLQGETKDFFLEVQSEYHTLKTATEKLRFLFQRFQKQQLTDERRKSFRLYTEFWLYSARQEDLKKLMEERYQEFTDFIQEIIKEGQESGEFKPMDAEFIAQIFWAIRDGNALHSSLLGEEEKYKKTWEMIEEFFIRGISSSTSRE
ncbi:transcriptional regulator, TetR family [Fictibacillus enclensis]|uniref:HTH tetR-type domain-containing protein n=1 Tax=Fictibacillus enclensis TaxID=1017270 RepID=A0A0V8IRQ9_9BACL|nr:TetR/AcrR family transcriptional regulator [Fictibacillus enclensis]KSU77361.1 hypothetical protein AS030_22105 [Fictibacillus enclensis]SCC41515.1 transcriptional regulator, TetR family [Fictibacillus enclensis]